MNTQNQVDAKLVEKYKGYAYMYAEYPNKNFWSKDIGEREFKEALLQLPGYKPNSPALLYIHFPFCPSSCFYCSCFKRVTRDYEKAKRHLGFINMEIEMLSEFCEKTGINPGIGQVHLGGGSPSYLKEEEFDALAERIDRIAKIKSLNEFAIEIDPRHVDKDRMIYYSSRGISRISFGVQEFNIEVQKAVNRVQPPELLESILTPDIRSRFRSTSFDILYGLPRQTKASFRKTMERVIKISPDRVVLLSFNYSPNINNTQRLINENELPSRVEKEEMFFETSEMMLENGYLRVGLEHFVKPADALAESWRTGDFNWNMGGYNKGRANKIIGVGPSSASRITDDFYFQDSLSLEDYEKLVASGKFPIFRGYKLSHEDKIRREVTTWLRSRLYLDYREVEQEFGINFKEFFKKEMGKLEEFEREGIITHNADGIKISGKGLPFVSFVCMNFDLHHKGG